MDYQASQQTSAALVAERKAPRATRITRAPGEHILAGSPAVQHAAARGEHWVSEPTAYDAIVLASFGGPNGQEDVLPFLRNVTAGRGIPDDRLEEVAVHYRLNGGSSPINGQNAALRARLESELARRGHNIPVYWGNRNWEPYIWEVVREAYEDGHRTLLAVPTSAYSGYSSCRQYREDFADALEYAQIPEDMRVDKLREFFDHPGFVVPFIEGLAAAYTQMRERGFAAEEIEVLFTTHSIPNRANELSGPPELGGGLYLRQHEAVRDAIRSAVEDQVGARLSWQMVFQSRSGPPHIPWLEPDINDVIETLPGRGRRAVVVVPIGFVSDHMEVLWDLDNEARATAQQCGLAFARVSTPEEHPAFVAGLADLVEERLEGRPRAQRAHLTEMGPWFDLCPAHSCRNPHLPELRAIGGFIGEGVDA
ncbi:ferrochelatase [Actinotignum sp. GS-2025f]|uniref:ferrochelatase n=1 Tax=unclassified Actinotignum TaxID=2632702 RepID=UPI002A8068C2|nr:ferrochelatase [Actinotignum sp. SLA_B059]MDY5127849.1 ferrochelatase [Actinotignum sp. SLA_B059]